MVCDNGRRGRVASVCAPCLRSQVLAQLYIFHILHSVTFVPGSASQTDTADLAASPDMQCWALNTFG